MYCTNCGLKINEKDFFCKGCGTKIENDKNIKTLNNSEDTVLDEFNYKIAQKESAVSLTLKVIGLIVLSELATFMHFFPNIPAFTSVSGVVIGFWFVVLLIALSNKPLKGTCPYCKASVKVPNKGSFVCPRCRKNVAIKDDRFMKIKNY